MHSNMLRLLISTPFTLAASGRRNNPRALSQQRQEERQAQQRQAQQRQAQQEATQHSLRTWDPTAGSRRYRSRPRLLACPFGGSLVASRTRQHLTATPTAYPLFLFYSFFPSF
jgi:hypothetical protein